MPVKRVAEVAAPEDSGLASGLLNATSQVGGALGLAILTTISTSGEAGPAQGAVVTSGT
jgi:hypothetical protein